MLQLESCWCGLSEPRSVRSLRPSGVAWSRARLLAARVGGGVVSFKSRFDSGLSSRATSFSRLLLESGDHAGLPYAATAPWSWSVDSPAPILEDMQTSSLHIPYAFNETYILVGCCKPFSQLSSHDGIFSRCSKCSFQHTPRKGCAAGHATTEQIILRVTSLWMAFPICYDTLQRSGNDGWRLCVWFRPCSGLTRRAIHFCTKLISFLLGHIVLQWCGVLYTVEILEKAGISISPLLHSLLCWSNNDLRMFSAQRCIFQNDFSRVAIVGASAFSLCV